MRIRRQAVVAAALVIGTVGAATVATTGEDETGSPVATAATGKWSAPGTPTPVDGSPSVAPRAAGRVGTPPKSTAERRPMTVPARPAAEVARAAPASVAHLTERYRVSPAEAARRLALQELAAPLAGTLAERFPDGYAGMWLDQDGGGVLTIAATDPAPVAAAVADLPDAGHVTVVPARHSLRQLAEAADRLATTLGARAGVDVLVDEKANEVVVLTDNGLAALGARLAEAISAVDVPVRTQARYDARSVPKACDPRYCAEAPMRGGIRLDIPRDNGTVGGCTSGFNVRSRSGEYHVLTAGHCVASATHRHRDLTWHQFLGPKVPVGIESTAPVLAENAFPYDYAVIPYQAGALKRWAYPKRGGGDRASLVNYWCVPDSSGCATRGSRDVKITGVTPYGAVLVGATVCATGSAYTPTAGERYVDSGAGAGYLPGTRCGEVIGKASGGIDVRICARPGDSGGPLFTESNGRALGILSTGDPGSGPCTNPNEKNVYAPVSLILDRVNARTGLGFEIATQGPLLAPVRSSTRP
ncbi:trypsin-like serine protease [Micromonospora sp. KC721]|uniref:trypsin-like serine protease n=1 Tax=Micromonospora sp. KC721 TaxID=2530380 RepID=UPI00104362C6|nr:trypsin-like serine protease [Micromonospora sp. KC721]TDB70339.1 trypsin-like serine protease [Micromonospora sp. KC721]